MNQRIALDYLFSTDGTQLDADVACVPLPCCPLCGMEGKQMYAALGDWASGVRGRWGMLRCAVCEIAWLDPKPAEQDISKLYPSRYYTHGSLSNIRFDSLRQRIRQYVLARMGYTVEAAGGLLPWILSYTPARARAAALDVMNLSASETGALLDVGCGNGQFLLRMRSLGWTVSGIDPDPAAVANCQSQNLEVFCGAIRDLPESACYDAITLSHVIEHVSDPIELLRECGKRLRPETGRLVVTTPNLDSLGHWWFKQYWRGLEIPRHLNLFSPAAFSRCAERAGLNLIALSTESRMARMIYVPSVYGKNGAQNVGERSDFSAKTKIAGYLFQFLEDALIKLKPNSGEEIFGVCAASAKL